MKFVILSALALVMSSSAMAASTCNTALEKQQLRAFMNGRNSEAPKCYVPGGVQYPAAKPIAETCKGINLQKARRYLNGNNGNADYPACLGGRGTPTHVKSSAGCSFKEKLQLRRALNRGNVVEPACYR